ncbi:hypothetical protein Hanom_Chr10g00928801 [Helianthus anomalus]
MPNSKSCSPSYNVHGVQTSLQALTNRVVSGNGWSVSSSSRPNGGDLILNTNTQKPY